MAGGDVGCVEEVREDVDVRVGKGEEDREAEAHRQLAAVRPGGGSLAERMEADRKADEIPPERLAECIEAFSSSLRDKVRAEFPLPDRETVKYEIVTDKPWSGFNYYEGAYTSTVAVNADPKQQMSNLPRLVAHESYPGHHTEHCRKEEILVGGGPRERGIHLGAIERSQGEHGPPPHPGPVGGQSVRPGAAGHRIPSGRAGAARCEHPDRVRRRVVQRFTGAGWRLGGRPCRGAGGWARRDGCQSRPPQARFRGPPRGPRPLGQ